MAALVESVPRVPRVLLFLDSGTSTRLSVTVAFVPKTLGVRVYIFRSLFYARLSVA